MINYIYNQMLYLQEWGFYLDGVWLWRICGTILSTKNGNYLKLICNWRGYLGVICNCLQLKISHLNHR